MQTKLQIRAVNDAGTSDFILEYQSEADCVYCLKKAFTMLMMRGTLTAVQNKLAIDVNGVPIQQTVTTALPRCANCGGAMVLHGVVATCEQCSWSIQAKQ